jgi:DNA-binding HxlR family transcriptional regulator
MTYSTKLTCPIQRTISFVGDKWKIIVLHTLTAGTKRFGELQRAMEGITPKVLTRQLRDLERDGLVARHVHPQVPPRVDYTLTPLGESLMPVLKQLHDWAVAHADEIAGARAREEMRDDDRRVKDSAA